MAAIDDLRTYLTTTLSSAYGDTVLAGVLDTEIADQAARIRTAYRMADMSGWDAHQPALREAVMRRSARNLALRKLPLGISESEAASMRVSGRDGEIRRLEAPFARVSVG